jgi:uncharacterized protein
MIDQQFTSALRKAARNVFPIVVLAALAGCISPQATTRPAADTRNVEARARAAEQSGNAAAAAELYAQAASGAAGTVRSGFLIDSARLLADQGDTAVARRRLNDGRATASRDQQQAITVLLAKLEVRDRRPQAALDMLAGLQQPVALPVQTDAAAVRGQAFFQLGRHVDAVRALSERELWLDDPAAILANQRMIWDGFRASPPPASLPLTGDRIIDGWLALAPLARTSNTDLRRELLGWRQTYTDHPAAGRLLAEVLALQRTVGFPSQIALLLPLSSPLRTEALAIRDGFVAAHLRRPGADATAIRVYDTAELGSREAYLRAQLEGADFIVGPLIGADVEQVITQAGFVPTLALNFARTDTPSLNSFYQFALSSADEARTIAASAASAGATTAIALVASNDRGYGVLDSFRDEFEAHGGELLDFSGYDPRDQDFSQEIMALLNITRSAQRQRRLAANLGVPVQFEPRLRQDVDLIFIQADSPTGRLLAPQLRYQGAGNIPTYATSEIYRPGSEQRDNDLNGVIFPDAPAIIAPNGDAAELQRVLQSYWPQRPGTVRRLYGMGFDAYELIAPLYNGSRTWPIRGMSGELNLDAQGRIHRSLPLAQFRNGRPVALEQPPPGAIDTRRLTGNR